LCQKKIAIAEGLVAFAFSAQQHFCCKTKYHPVLPALLQLPIRLATGNIPKNKRLIYSARNAIIVYFFAGDGVEERKFHTRAGSEICSKFAYVNIVA
jgi:hypothetical protein